MENEKLLRELSKLGLPLFEIDVDANETITGVVKSRNIRLWEGFPVLLVNVNKESFFNYEKVKTLLTKRQEYRNFVNLILLSFSVYKYFHLQFFWQKDLKKKIQVRQEGKIKEFLNSMKNNNDITIARQKLNSQRIKNFFNNYFRGENLNVEKMYVKSKGLSLEYALSQIFTPTQKDIFLKKIKGEKLTKSQRERFYRVVKKKVIALLNPELQRLAEQLLGHHS